MFNEAFIARQQDLDAHARSIAILVHREISAVAKTREEDRLLYARVAQRLIESIAIECQGSVLRARMVADSEDLGILGLSPTAPTGLKARGKA